MSATRRARRLAVLAVPVAGLVAVLGAAGCSTTDDTALPTTAGSRPAGSAVESSTTTSTAADATTAVQTPTSGARLPTAPTSTPGAPTTAPPTTAASTAPAITSIHGPTSADCDAPTGMVTITVTYTAANATNVEYLAPGSDRPGAQAASGSVQFNYDCSQASQVFKVRAFDEFNGSDAKDPSPYASVTVNRRLTGASTTTTSTAP
jgi:hypothetical protein